MIRRNLLPLAVLLVLVSIVGVPAQSKRKPQAKPASAPKMTATGLLYFGGDGQGIQTCLLKTPDRIIEISVTSKTRVLNFPASGAAWKLGSEWRVIYYKSKDAALGLEADTVTFTGKRNPAITAAEGIARAYLKALSSENKNYGEAYAELSATAQQNLSVANFKKIYEPVDFDLKTIRVCSHSVEKVVLLLGFFTVDDTLYQRVEVGPIDDEYFKDQFRINRLFDFEKSVDEAEAACGKQ